MVASCLYCTMLLYILFLLIDYRSWLSLFLVSTFLGCFLLIRRTWPTLLVSWHFVCKETSSSETFLFCIFVWSIFYDPFLHLHLSDYPFSHALDVKFTNSGLSFSLFYFSFLFSFCFIFLFSIFRTTRVRVDQSCCYISHNLTA